MKYICEKCDKVFRQKIDYTRHINRMKSCDIPNEVPQCKFCEKIYSTRSNLTKHLHTCKIKKSIENNKLKKKPSMQPTQQPSKPASTAAATQTKKKRKHIPKIIKNKVWDKYIGREGFR
jgi:hypothetical protein